MASKLVFATNNLHKLKEVNQIIGKKFQLLSLDDISCPDEIPEDYMTLEENASQKAWYVFKKYNMSCFADDTGLEVDALNGEPGVFSARYGGNQKNSNDNVRKLLSELNNETNRAAQFRTIISLIINGNEKQFQGIVRGQIIDTPTGTNGFGYDPIFMPDGFTKTFAQMEAEQKNILSHRAIAIRKLTDYLLNI
ncbi:MAG: non-canonical purine NTP diphosphatase [Bacteroidales bacterium]